MRLAEERFYNQYPCSIITAKGQPDVGTRLFLKNVLRAMHMTMQAVLLLPGLQCVQALKLPVLALMDGPVWTEDSFSVHVWLQKCELQTRWFTYLCEIQSMLMRCLPSQMSYDSLNPTTPDIKWLGVRPSDLA